MKPAAEPGTADARISAREFVSLAVRAFALSYKARGRAAVVMAFLGLACAFLPSATSLALRVFTDAVQTLFQTGEGLRHACVLLAALIGVNLLQQGYNALKGYYTGSDAERIARYINERLLRISCTVRMRHIEGDDDFAEKISFASGHAGLQVANSMQEVTTWLQNLVAFGALALVMADVSPWIVPVVLLTCLPSAAVSYRQESERYDMNRRQSRNVAFAQMYFQDCTRFQCVQENRFLGIFPYLKERKWRTAAREVLEADDELTRRHTLVSCATDLLRGSVYLFVLFVAARSVYADPAVGLGAFTLVVSATSQMQNLTQQLFFGAAQFAAHAHYMKDFFDLEDFEREAVCAEPAPPAPQEKGGCGAEIAFEGVTFYYPGSSRPALRDVNVRIAPGERVAVVGRNGSGKSTFINLLCGLYEPSEGSVCLDGREVRDDVAAARGRLTAVFQNFGRYEDTIRFNVEISDPGRTSDDGVLMDLLEQAGAREFVCGRPGGLDAVVGSYSEGGANLSGGQWQRLAIARAGWRERARVVLLDEPTSALDPVAEANVYRNFADIVGNRTALFVSHRLGVSSVVDRVLVFDDGCIVEDGTPDELLDRGGLYAELWQAQAQWYAG